MRRRLVITVTVIVFAVFCLTGCTVSFKYESVVKAARERGIKSVSLQVFEKFQEDGEYEGEFGDDSDRSEHYYFVAKNSTEANSLYGKYFRLTDGNNVSIDELACCVDDEDGILYFRAASEEDAKKIYDEWSGSFKEDYEIASSGNKKGYVYTVCRNYSSTDPSYRSDIGVYRKGKDVFIVGETEASRNAQKSSFFESLGLVKPADVIK